MKKWKPIETSDRDSAFGGDMKKLLPPWETIPKEFKDGHTKWNSFFSRWHFTGLPKTTRVTPKEGIETAKALAHIKAVMASWEPKHEHKESGCAFLLSEFFEDFSYGEDK